MSKALTRAAEVLREYADMIDDSERYRSGPLNGTLPAAAQEEVDEYRALAVELDACSAESEAIRYYRARDLDKRIGLGDDFAGDAWVRYVAVGHDPNAAPQELPAVNSASRQALPSDRTIAGSPSETTPRGEDTLSPDPVRDSAKQPAGAAPGTT